MQTIKWRKELLIGIAYCISTVAADWLSNIGIYRALGVTPWTPAAGLAVAYAYGRGIAAWPFVAMAELAMMAVSNPVPLGIPAKIATALPTAACWIGAAEALRKTRSFEGSLRSSTGLFYFFAIGIIASVAQAVVYSSSLLFGSLIPTEAIYSVWWRVVVGALVGILVVTPLAVLLHNGWRPSRISLQNVFQFLLLVSTVWAIFNLHTATTYQLFYLLFLPMIWVAMRDGVGGTAILLNLAQIGIIVGASMRADILPGTGSLQVLMIALAMTGLVVGSIVSEREDGARRLQEQSAALGRTVRLRSAGETAAAIAHQINQPITAISTYAGVARDALGRGDAALAGTALEKLTEQCDRAASVMRSIRDLVRQGTLTRAPIRLQKLLTDLKSMHAAECSDLGIRVDINIPSSYPPIMADAIQLEQAVDNLLVNCIEAIRETERPGTIVVNVHEVGAETHIVVEDNGPGFAPGLDSIATTPFMTTKTNGSGLGLAIARSVAEAHGGSLSILHRSQGASVRLRLPTTGTNNVQKIDQHH